MDNRMDERDAELLRSRSRAAFDAQAPTYDIGMEGDHARRLYPHVLAEVARAVAGNPAPRLLDLGCGTGSLAALVLEGVPGARLSCVDLSPRMAEAARARLGEQADVLLCDAERLPFTATARSTPRGATTPSTTTRTPSARHSRRGACSSPAAPLSSVTRGSRHRPARL